MTIDINKTRQRSSFKFFSTKSKNLSKNHTSLNLAASLNEKYNLPTVTVTQARYACANIKLNPHLYFMSMHVKTSILFYSFLIHSHYFVILSSIYWFDFFIVAQCVFRFSFL